MQDGAGPQHRRVLATYRLQLGPNLDLDAASALLPYLHRLGVSHVYASPVLQAAPGSTHGYDVVDPSRVSDELGGDAAWERFLDAASAHDMGVVLDIVPNHMAIAGRHNRWWWDLLENGPSSRYATYFDVNWNPPERRLRHTILMPVLGDHYGRVLERGELTLERSGGRVIVRYHEHEFPVAVDTLTTLLRQADQAIGCAALGALAARCARLPELHPTAREDAGRRHEEKEAILTALTTICADEPGVAGAVDRELSAIAGEPDRLDDLLEAQHYRLARWQVGAQDLDYRRFFDIQSLAGLRVEDPQVFEDTHRLLLGWLDRGRLDGLRIDHVDGLRDPQQYLDRLAAAASGTPIWVEKILEFGERLSDTWPVAGTTGYDGGALIQQVLLDAAGERALTELWDAFGEERRPSWPDLAREAREEALQTSLAADLARLAEAFVQVGEQNRRFRDFTRVEMTEALQGVLSVFPCYRTYVRPADGTVRAQDAGMIRTAVAAARDARPHLDAELFDLLAAILLGEGSSDVESEFVARFQQTSGPVRAKGVEDTAFYRYLRLVALNEVGADPGRFG
ncbi:MAG: malto-oligosyltrehalose synthase [Candidatus Dormiibacterota bacterium]